MYKIYGVDGTYTVGNDEVKVSGIDGLYDGDCGEDSSRFLVMLDDIFHEAGYKTDFVADDCDIWDNSRVLGQFNNGDNKLLCKRAAGIFWDNIDYDSIERGYLINYHTGVGNEYALSIEAAKEAADKGAAYTQQNISIEDVLTGVTVAIRRWYGVSLSDDVDWIKDPINFGDFGYYDDWVDIDKTEDYCNIEDEDLQI